ncbi:MAG TPA: hypothetical protein VGO04_08770 [Ensifer sp.]|jgi:hypothetical protein|uniref:hypothetical protein n=1 Tax=Ensifer sp. TaxID=1872086 RepID=UPI002E159F9B|nr:hypothetical protein [Ensifer sp.]
MRNVIAAFAIAALAAAPCAWGSDPGEPGLLAAIFAGSTSDVANNDASPALDTAFPDEVLHTETADAFSH